MFDLVMYRATLQKDGENAKSIYSVVIKLRVGDKTETDAADGEHLIPTLEKATRKVLRSFFPCIDNLTFDSAKLNIKTEKPIEVTIRLRTKYGEKEFETAGVSKNIVDAGWLALSGNFKEFLEFYENEAKPG